MAPEQHSGPYSVLDEQPIRGTGTRIRLLPLCKAHRRLNLPGERGDPTSGRQDGRGLSTRVLGGVQAGQGIRLAVLGTGTVGQ